MVLFKSTSHKIASADDAARYISDYKLVGTDNWYNRYRFETVIKFMHDSSEKKLLDYGCGNGLFLKYLHDNGWSMSLNGFDPYMIVSDDTKKLESRGINLQKSFENVDNTTYDFVTALDVIEHIEDDKQALIDIRKILTPNGKLLLIIPSHPWLYSLHDAAGGHYRRYTKKAIQAVLMEAGFTVIHQEYFFVFLIPVSILVKYYLLVKRLMGGNTSINELPSNPCGVFSLAIKLEKFLMKCGIKSPCGHSMFVYARKTK